MSDDGRVRIGPAAEIGEGSTVGFTFRDECGLLTDGFVIRWRGGLYAYVNRCPHQPLSLDYGDGDVLDEGGDLLLCRNHGALFEPNSGYCVAGPCHGAHLPSLEVECDADGIVHVATPPESATRELS